MNFENIKQEHVLIVAVSLVSIFVLFLLVRLWRRYQSKRKIRNMIKKISYDFVEDVEIDEGLDQYAHFDFICLGKQGVHIFSVKNYAGHIFAADEINEWSQILDRKSYKFPNPGFELSHGVELLKTMTDLEVTGYNIFSDAADFPKGQPDNVILCADIFEFFGKMNRRNMSEPVLIDWQKLKQKLA